ncbi:vomeronasal 1 receptor ornAnaV1R3077 [Ornithorhynchus anatinus]|uniref:Vomeronasal type-1 receptor n=1 Tax=Ornithorhynchus anatinus TaxID=9258 RepID=A0A6I8P2Z8_ORNAN|nr:vomeronasal 1 receptor ornAnaV1R3077 [Ornithorhynchus anatinus]
MILLQISIGVCVNIFLLLFYAHVVSATHKLSPSDLVLSQLVLANTIILLTFGVTETLSAWGLKKFLDDAGCKILMYLYRVARGLSICSTCLLSVFQAVTISPGTSRLARIKARLPRCIVLSCLLSWGLNMLIEFDTLMNITFPRNSNSVHIILDLKYCTKVSDNVETTLLIAIVFSLRDLVFVGLMSLASGYMVFILHRHHRRVRHLHAPRRSTRAMPEVRAAKRVVALVALYVLLYGRQTILLSIIMNTRENSPLLVRSHTALGFTFSAVSPFLIISSDRRMRTFWKKDYPVCSMDR